MQPCPAFVIRDLTLPPDPRLADTTFTCSLVAGHVGRHVYHVPLVPDPPPHPEPLRSGPWCLLSIQHVPGLRYVCVLGLGHPGDHIMESSYTWADFASAVAVSFDTPLDTKRPDGEATR